MSKPTQWTTTYSSVFRDRRKYESPDHRPSDDSYNVRTQAYYGTSAALSEHAARTAEVEARTDYGTKQVYEQTAAAARFGGGGPSSANRTLLDGANRPYGATPSTGYVRFAHPQKDLWTHPILPHTGVVRENIPIYAGQSMGGFTPKATFPNGYNNGYSTEFHFTGDQYTSPVEEKPFKPEGFIPGYQGFVRGSQFVHGNTFGKTTKELQSVPTSVPLQP